MVTIVVTEEERKVLKLALGCLTYMAKRNNDVATLDVIELIADKVMTEEEKAEADAEAEIRRNTIQ